MIYELLYPLRDAFHAFNVFRYVTFRSMYAALTALVISFLLGKWFIARLKALKVGQPVRTDGPQTHLKKSGTPTMGGMLILLAVLVATLLWARIDNRYVWMLVFATVWFGGIGMWDDICKLRARRSDGLSARTKLLLQTLGASAIMAAYYFTNPAHGVLSGRPGEAMLAASALNLPFVKAPVVLHPLVHSVLAVLVIVFISNAVNLTDGLDGLAAGTAAPVSITFVVAAYLAGHFKLAEYLGIPFIPGMGEVAVVMAAVFGACLGFLWFNAYPAAMFMGDTGSLALGGLFGTAAVLSKEEHLLAIVGGIFVIEALSVMIQVTSFKLRGKRVFKMAPLHHHFELYGWDEPKVIVRFWIVSILLVLVALSTLKLR